MAFFNASTSASLSSEGGLTEEDLKKFEGSDLRNSRDTSVLQRTLSTPAPSSSYRQSRSSTCPSRSFNWNIDRSNFSSRSFRSISSPSRMSFTPVKQNLQKFHSLVESSSSSSFDFSSKDNDPKNLSCQSVDNSHFSEQELFGNSNEVIAELSGVHNLLVQNCANRVGRSISSPEGLHPVSLQRPSNCYPFYSPSSPGRFAYSSSARTESHGVLNGRTGMYTAVPTANHLPSPSVSFSGDYQITSSDRSVQNACSPAFPGASRSLNSSLYSSRTSDRGGMDSESLAVSGTDQATFQGRQGASSYWPGEPSPRVNVRLLRGATEERPRLSQLALAHLTSRDLSSIHFQTPPPSYEKLCNPEALPTYQEAIEGERRGLRRFQDHRMVFTLPSVPDYNASHTDPLLQDSERNFSGGILASLAAELSDSEGGYTTILDAIPGHLVRESSPPVPVRFVSRWSLHRLRPPRARLPCCTSVCNEALVRKELNRRWPFIVGAREDERCLGLLLVECSSNLTVAQLFEAPPSSGPAEGGVLSSQEALESSLAADSEGNENEFSALNLNLETTAMNSHVVFYLCGKCVSYDSFDADRVRTHIDYDCTGHANKWANMSELYLVMRAFCFVLVVILVLMWLPFGRW